jgi:tetratricopeptide (TPR) repeat protein
MNNAIFRSGFFWILFLIIFCSCVSTPKTESADSFSLDEAIEQSAIKLIEELPNGTRVAIVAFSSEHDNLSNYIMDEITGALVDGRLEVADRRNLSYVYQELNFQMSGDVSDETAVSIGKFLGARYVITGQFIKAGDRFRYRLSGINVETATQESSSRINVRIDRSLQNLIADTRRMSTVTVVADYGERPNTQIRTAGAYIDRGIIFATRGEWDMAIADFTEAISLDNNLASAYLLRGRALFSSAAKVVNIGENFSNVTSSIDNGWSASSQQLMLYDKAINDFTQAIMLDQNSGQAYQERATAYAHKGENNRAISDYTQAIRLTPNNVRVYMGRGNIYSINKDYVNAIADHTQAIRLDPNNAMAYDLRGIDYLEKGDYDRAIADFNQAIRLNSHDAITYANRGQAYYNRGDYARARADWTMALRLNHPDPSILRNNLEVLREMGY